MSIVAPEKPALFAALPPDPAQELLRLAETLRMSQGFTLLFAVVNQNPERARLMAELETLLPDKTFQHLPFTDIVSNLYRFLNMFPPENSPDALFVYGLEQWIPAGHAGEITPFILNLNITRNHFPKVMQCPLVLWLPEHLLYSLHTASPDFFSVTSGIFLLNPLSHAESHNEIQTYLTNQTVVVGLSPEEREEHITRLEKLLSEYRKLPEISRDRGVEVRLLGSLGLLHLSNENYTKAEILYNEAIEIVMSAFPTGHPDFTTSLNNLAVVYELQGRHDEAEVTYKVILGIERTAFPENHRGISGILYNLAALYEAQGRYTEAESLYKEALAIRQNALLEDHPDVAAALNNLATIYCMQHRYSEAEPLYKNALAIRQKALPEGHPDIAQTLYNLAQLYASQGRDDEAEPLYKEALAIWQKTLPENHPDTARRLTALAAWYKSQGRYAEAEHLYKDAVIMFKQVLPEGHLDIAYTLDLLAAMYYAQSRYIEAEPLWKDGLTIKQKTLPEGHPDIATNINNLAVLYANQHRWDEALANERTALQMRVAALGKKHPDTQNSVKSLTNMLTASGKTEINAKKIVAEIVKNSTNGLSNSMEK